MCIIIQVEPQLNPKGAIVTTYKKVAEGEGRSYSARIKNGIKLAKKAGTTKKGDVLLAKDHGSNINYAGVMAHTLRKNGLKAVSQKGLVLVTV
jgi:DNA invertase Pin-like site-specific DNA recombinase